MKTRNLLTNARGESWVWVTVLSCVLALMLSGCKPQSDSKLDDAKEAVEEAAEETSEAVQDVAESTGEAVGHAAESAGEIAKEAGEKLSEGFAAARDKAAAALENVEGGGELLEKIKEFFSSAESTLKSVNDKESAQAAREKLGHLDEAVDKIGEKLRPLPEKARVAVAAMIEQGAAQLQALREKLSESPEVQNELKPKWDALMDKLKSLTKE